MTHLFEYIWIDGTEPTKQLRSKTKVLMKDPGMPPAWGADGSSTNQADGLSSDIILEPVRVIPDPTRENCKLVLCEVLSEKDTPHPTNTRALLRKVLEKTGDQKPMCGFEQEYTMLKSGGQTPLGFPDKGYPGPQGPYYCAVGSDNIAGREVYEDFIKTLSRTTILVTGYNWEVMPGQAEFQIFGEALEASDHLWLARYILHRVAEDHNVVITLDPKPAPGDWNGAGMHTNFSTERMRAKNGIDAIKTACDRLGEHVQAHLEVYGDGYQARLTGAHETAKYDQFKYGVGDRTASIRIPKHVAADGCGYLEDRRPNANADPYEVATRIIKTVCEID